MAAAAIAVIAAGGCLTSCEKFDDTELQNSIKDLNSRVEALESAVASLQSDVDAISSLVNGGKIIKSISSNEDGTEYTITYAGEDVAPDIITVGSGEPVITVIEEGGEYYWAVIGDDGNPQHILGSDNKVPVASETAVPMLDVSEDGKLLVSVDKGSTWSETGVTVSDICTPTFSNVEVKEGSVIFTLQNGTSFEVEMVSELTCEFISGFTRFENGETKKLMINAGGYDKYELIVPDGWEAEFDGSSVSVTAPNPQWDENYETSGEVVIRVYNTLKKEVLMDNVSVRLGGSSTLSVNTVMTDGVVNIEVSMLWEMPFYMGVSTLDEFSAEKAAASAGEAIVPATATYTVPFTDFVQNPVIGEAYVIWYVADDYSGKVSSEDIETYIYNYGLNVEFSVDNITFNDADVTVTPGEATEYYFGISPVDYFSAESILRMVSMGMFKARTDPVADKLSVLNQSNDQALTYEIYAGTEYVIWTIIKKDSGIYSTDDLKMDNFTLNPLEEGGTAQVEFGEAKSTATSIDVPYTLPENTYQLYVTFISDSDFASVYGSDEAKVKEALLNSIPYNTDVNNYGNYTLSPNTAGKVYAVVVDNDGKIGPMVSKSVSTTDVEHDAGIGIEAGSYNVGTTTVSVPLTITGSPAKLIYYLKTKDLFESNYQFKGDVNKVVSQMGLQPNYYMWTSVSVSSLEGSTLEVSGLNFSEDYVLIATVVGETGLTSSDYISIEFTTDTPTIVESTDPSYASAVPSVSELTFSPTDWGSYYISAEVTPAGEGMWYYYTTTMEYQTTLELVSAIMQNGNGMEGAGMIDRSVYSDTTLYVLWVAADGTIYAPIAIPVVLPA